MQWFYIHDGQRVGPVEESELRRLAQSGELAPSDLVWNPTMEQEWEPASAVPGLFASSPALAPAFPGTTSNRDLMARARRSLRGQWALAVGIALLYGLVANGFNMASKFGSSEWKIAASGLHVLLAFFISGPLVFGWNRFFLAIARGEAAHGNLLFDGFKMFGKTWTANFLMSLFVILWSLLAIVPAVFAALLNPLIHQTPELGVLILPLLVFLFVLSLLPAIRAVLGYSLIFYLLSDRPELRAVETLRLSRQMMDGFKWKKFCLGFRFIGWVLLCIPTFGIGFLWLSPYMATASAHFYDDIRIR
ncbi:MAG: DUF975 family protein [Kiritimatiellia bacterium]